MTRKTLLLFTISLVLSLASLYTGSKGFGEIYPFFSWRLFTKPSGSSKTDVQYRIYGIKGKDTIRLANTASPLFDENERASFIDKFGDKITQRDDEKKYKEKLLVLAKIVAPEYENYLLVKETFNAQEIDRKKFKIHKQPITVLK